LTDAPGPTLETLPASAESPRLIAVRSVEGVRLEARRVPGVPEAAFAAFLDGTQASRAIGYYRGVPIVHGTVGAVVRVRRDRRLVTWDRGPLVRRAVYAPRQLLPAAMWAEAEGSVDLVDTSAPAGREPVLTEDGRHPTALLERAVHVVQGERERLERELAEAWCRTADAPVYIDGSISGAAAVATSRLAVGVVKRHGALYVAGDQLSILADLGAGERTTAFRLEPGRRSPVSSWYLRLRDPSGRDPFWGLARVEVADDTLDVTSRADEVSRWVLAETAPVALPDARWPTMTYGIHDCEEFLRAIM
jgi:hypothetical protein